MEEKSIVAFDFGRLASNIRKNICGVFKFIFWKTYEKNMVHYKLSLMLNHMFIILYTSLFLFSNHFKIELIF